MDKPKYGENCLTAFLRKMKKKKNAAEKTNSKQNDKELKCHE